MPILIVFLLFFSLLFPKPAYASVSSCTVSVSPNAIPRSISKQLDFNVKNTSDTDANWIGITPPASFDIIFPLSTDWQTHFEDKTLVFDHATLAAGDSTTLSLYVTPSDNDTPAQDFTVNMTDLSDGSNQTPCGGDYSVAVFGDGTPPVISSIVISDVTDTTVNVGWTTDEPSISSVYYDTTGDYSLSNIDQTLTTSHSVNLTGLTPNTTYSYRVGSTDASGNDESLKSIPVVMLTNLAGQSDAEKALAMGAIKYIVKSEYDPKQVTNMVKEILAGYTRNEIPKTAV